MNRRRFIGVAAAALFTRRLPSLKPRPFIGVDMARKTRPSRTMTSLVTIRSPDGVYDYLHIPIPADWIVIDFVVRADGKVEFREVADGATRAHAKS